MDQEDEDDQQFIYIVTNNVEQEENLQNSFDEFDQEEQIEQQPQQKNADQSYSDSPEEKLANSLKKFEQLKKNQTYLFFALNKTICKQYRTEIILEMIKSYYKMDGSYYYKIIKDKIEFISQSRSLLMYFDEFIETIQNKKHTLVFSYHIFEKGIKVYDEKLYEKALSIFKQGFKIDPTSENCLMFIGLCYFMMNDYEKSIVYFDQCFSMYPRFNYPQETILNNKGLVYLYKQEYQKAEVLLKQARNKHFANPFKHLGVLYSRLKKYDKALKYFKKALKIQPNYDFLTKRHLKNEQDSLKNQMDFVQNQIVFQNQKEQNNAKDDDQIEK